VRFYIPKTLQSDFSSSLEALGTTAIINFDPLNTTKIRLDKVNYTTKNSVVSSDEVAFAELSSNLKMGDYLQYKNEVLLINQLVSNEFPQCYEISSGTCNTKFDVTRFQTATYDDFGNVLTEEGNNPITKDLYCLTVMGGFEFRTHTGGIGIVPSNDIKSSCQFNADTMLIAIGDKFTVFKKQYEVVNLDWSQKDLEGDYGILMFDGKKVIS